jgi:phosphoenolpyruvate synthase/pyruvate phosphate dikinase
VARRTAIKKEILKNAFWFELFDVFSDKKLAARLSKRKAATCLYVNGKIIYSDKIIIREPVIKAASKILKGTVASAGYAQGLIQIVHGPQDFSRFKKGNILAAFTTRPDFVPVMRKASAILTQEGGLTCHAAIISRELQKPCIVGIKGLIDLLNGNDKVEVNANKGVVKKL